MDIAGNYSGPYEINSSGLTYVFAKNSFGNGSNTATIYLAFGMQNTVTLNGSVNNSNAPGVQVDSIENKLTNSKTGIIDAYTGISLVGAGNSVTNAGTIAADYIGVEISGENNTVTNTGSITAPFAVSLRSTADGSKFINNGTIDADAAIAFVSCDATVEFGSKSKIDFDGTALAMDGSFDQEVHITNAGSFKANVLINGAAGRDVVKNTGTMNGIVNLNDGHDSFDTSKGKFTGTINGGDGDDVFTIRSAKTVIGEAAGEGNDTIRTIVSLSLVSSVYGDQEIENVQLIGKAKINATGNDLANILTGNAGKNRLVGGEGADRLDGGKGDDQLLGGADADSFVFRTGRGHDRITDYSIEDGDIIDVSKWSGMDNLGELKAAAHKIAGGVMIEHGHDSLAIMHFSKADLVNLHFDFDGT